MGGGGFFNEVLFIMLIIASMVFTFYNILNMQIYFYLVTCSVGETQICHRVLFPLQPV